MHILPSRKKKSIFFFSKFILCTVNRIIISQSTASVDFACTIQFCSMQRQMGIGWDSVDWETSELMVVEFLFYFLFVFSICFFSPTFPIFEFHHSIRLVADRRNEVSMWTDTDPISDLTHRTMCMRMRLSRPLNSTTRNCEYRSLWCVHA